MTFKPGYKPSDKTRRKLSAASRGNTASKGRVWSAESRANLSAAMKGNKNSKGHCPTPEHRRKISEANKGNANRWLGRKHTDDTRAKISASLIGHGASEKARLNFSIANRVIKLFKPELAAAIASASRSRMTAQMQDPAFLAARAAGQRARRERIAAAKAPTEAPADRRKRLADMNASGMSQADIARAVGLSPQRVNTLIKKHRAISADGAGMGA